MKHLFLLIGLFILTSVSSQEAIYTLDWKKDLAFTGVGIGMNVIGILAQGNLEIPTEQEINGLNRLDVNSFDRPTIDNFSEDAVVFSEIFIYTSLAVPALSYSLKKVRDQRFAMIVMALETYIFTSGVTNITKAAVGRFRPLAYNPDVPLALKLKKDARLSFFSGHSSVTAAMSIYSAKVLTDIYPESKYKWLIWTAGAGVPASVSYFRYQAGKHFPTDLITGYIIGGVLGYLIPEVHRNKNMNLGIGMTGNLDFRLIF